MDAINEWRPGVVKDKKARRLQRIHVLIMSASKEGEQVARKAGACGYISKPFDIDKLYSIIDDHISKEK